jgi:Flp pilus assembly pilin Flp
MHQMIRKLWNDDQGALIASEWLFIATIMVIGLVVGLVYIRNAVTSKLSEFAQAIMYVNVGYQYPGLDGKFSASGALATTPGATVRNYPIALQPIRDIASTQVSVQDDPQN